MPVRRCVVVGCALAFVVCGAACRTASPGSNRGEAHQGHAHRDLDGYIAAMLSEGRETWQQPAKVLAALKLRKGERVADIGAGPGYFTLPMAKQVGPRGQVWAVDVEPEMLDRLRERASETGATNITCVLAPVDDPRLPAGGVDTIFIVNTYHHIDNRIAYFGKMRRALAPGGRVVILDFVPRSREARGFGPPLSMQLSRDAVDKEAAAAGMRAVSSHDFLTEQYFVEYRSESETTP